jgi:hypothetical protein
VPTATRYCSCTDILVTVLSNLQTPQLNLPVLNEHSRGRLSTKFAAALKFSLPELRDSPHHWIIHYSPAIVTDDAGEHRESYIVIDRSALYLFAKKSSAGSGCKGNDAVLRFETPLRIPFSKLTKVTVAGKLCFCNSNFRYS